MVWETEFEPFFDNPNLYQDPNVIDSNRTFDNDVPIDIKSQKFHDSRNLIVDTVIDAKLLKSQHGG